MTKPHRLKPVLLDPPRLFTARESRPIRQRRLFQIRRHADDAGHQRADSRNGQRRAQSGLQIEVGGSIPTAAKPVMTPLAPPAIAAATRPRHHTRKFVQALSGVLFVRLFKNRFEWHRLFILSSAKDSLWGLNFSGLCAFHIPTKAHRLNRLRKNSTFCHSEARCAPRNLSFPTFKPKRDSSVAAATSE